MPDPDNINFHAQTTFIWQGFPAFRSPFAGAQSLPGGGEGRETWDVTLYAGARLWHGAEVWANPEIDQGHGLSDTHGVAGFASGESYKLGFDYPLRPRAALFCPTDHRSRRRNRESGCRHQSVRQLADGKPPSVDSRQVLHPRHIRHQQIRQQSQN
jgi:hypothetical protein